MSKVDLSQVEWRKSSFSGANGNCVEVAMLPDAVAMRDSKNPTGPVLLFTPAEWTAFEAGMLNGEFKR